MTPENLIKELERYRAELTNVMQRFTQSGDGMFSGLHMNRDDDPRLRTFVIEIIDLLDDALGENQYSLLVQRTYNSGYSAVFLSYSYKCVEDMVATLDSIITRIKRNPELCNPKSNKTELKPMEYPNKITLKWLYTHVPYRFWTFLLGLLFAAFILGTTFANTKLYKSLIALITPNST